MQEDSNDCYKKKCHKINSKDGKEFPNENIIIKIQNCELSRARASDYL